MADKFSKTYDDVTAPAKNPYAVTPSDTNSLASYSKALFIGTGGNVSVVAVGGTDPVVFKNLPDAYILDVRCKKVMATGTTALDIVALV